MNNYEKTGIITKKEKRVLNSTELILKLRNSLFSYLVAIPGFY